MLMLKIFSVLLAIFIVGVGLYFLKIKHDKNRNSMIVGYTYVSLGILGLLISFFYL